MVVGGVVVGGVVVGGVVVGGVVVGGIVVGGMVVGGVVVGGTNVVGVSEERDLTLVSASRKCTRSMSSIACALVTPTMGAVTPVCTTKCGFTRATVPEDRTSGPPTPAISIAAIATAAAIPPPMLKRQALRCEELRW
jgi:hypothetical protein